MYLCVQSNFGFKLTILSGFGPWELVQACFSIDLVYFWVNLDHFKCNFIMFFDRNSFFAIFTMYKHVHIHVHTHVHMYVYTCTHTCTMYTCTLTCTMYTCTHTHKYKSNFGIILTILMCLNLLTNSNPCFVLFFSSTGLKSQRQRLADLS